MLGKHKQLQTITYQKSVDLGKTASRSSPKNSNISPKDRVIISINYRRL